MKPLVLFLLLTCCQALLLPACGSDGGPARSHDATLMALLPSVGALAPAFASATTDYALTVPAGTATFTVSPTASDPAAKSIEWGQDGGAFTTVPSGTPAGPLVVPAAGSPSSVAFRVTAADGNTVLQYNITLTVQATLSVDATLSALAPSAGTLIPVFEPKQTDYLLRIPFGTASVTLTPVATSSAASIKVSGASVASGQPTPSLALPTDGTPLTITISVTAEDRVHTTTYSVRVTAMSAPDGKVTLYTVGDSTMANYDPAFYPKQRGWAQQLPTFIADAKVTLVNNGVNGTSSKSYYSTLWNGVKSKLRTGDYVFIQFGHNDEKDSGIEGASGVGTDAWGAYHGYLTRFVRETRALGAIPVLMTPVVRLSFSGATLSPTACHDLTGNGIAVGNADYPAAMRAVAIAESCPLVDMTAATQALVEQYGPTSAKSILYISTDNTHLQPMGATLYAQLAAQGLAAQGILGASLNPSLELVVTPSAWSFGPRFVGSSFDQAFSVTGVALAPVAGNLTVTAPAGFLVGTSLGEAFSSTFQLPYTLAALPTTTLYVRFQPLAEQAYGGDVTIAAPSGNLQRIAVTGKGVAPLVGGAEAQAFYALDSTTAGGTCAATGLLTCTDETLSGLYVKNYQTMTALTPPSTSTGVQHVSITNATTADMWPTETDINSQRFVEFAVSPGPGKTLHVDGISLYAGADGGATMAFRIQYSKQADFGAATELLDSPSNATGVVNLYTLGPLVAVGSGETFRLRVFPYSKAQVTTKYLCLQSVTIHGITM
jgi:lysophospholipase L1-like esterase